ncbi:RusA family crossover junction endodeoxyribonuclease [Pararhodobacter zhoushanensis]|uniref:RusA family crossover junction endodeoxyribonuclease n=1 Tax=Pararhodobacter zhoushanensis TaxID=2479545 RepID=UPI000F8F7798|nr:RusA family crossover junction endodeoxyribonuclease [Pararhodobacter zhoushanensis]
MAVSPSSACLALPGPISTNNLFCNVPGKGRVHSAKYKTWRASVLDAIRANASPRFTLPVAITLYVGEHSVGNMDSDNTLKGYLDAFVRAGVIVDDSRRWVRSATAVWTPAMAGAVAVIELAPLSPVASEIVALVPRGLRELLR